MSKHNDKTPATILLHTDKFLETKNFSYAMSAFCWARAIGHPIPEVILDFIEEAFLEWAEHNGQKPLDEILGINAGKGKKSALNAEWTKQRNTRLFCTMATLVGLGWKVTDAAEAACVWLQKQYEANPVKYKHLNPSNAGRERDPEALLDAKTLADYWTDKKFEIQRTLGEKDAISRLLLWNDQKKEEHEKLMCKLMGKQVKKKKINFTNYINQLINK